MRLSIIIPAYNVEQYLERCIDSCEKQDIPHEDYEVIIVNDGSSDNTLQVANNLAEKYSNIIVLSQDNQGQSVARNVGIEHAKGDYIWFVDSDDYIDENCIKELLDKVVVNDLDVLLFYLKIKKQNEKLKREVAKQPIPINTVFNQGQILYNGFMPGTICGSIINKSLIIRNKLRFIPKLIHEDAEFSMRLLALAKTTMFIENAPFTYYIHEGSTLTDNNIKKDVKRLVDDARIAKYLREFAIAQRSNGMDEKLVNHLLIRSRSIHFGTLYRLYKCRKQLRKNGVNAEVIKQMKGIDMFPMKSPYNNWKQHLVASVILNHSILYC